MKDMVEIEVILDEHYVDPRVTIRTRANTPQVENIIIAIENVSNSDYPQIAAMKDSSLVFISQRDRGCAEPHEIFAHIPIGDHQYIQSQTF